MPPNEFTSMRREVAAWNFTLTPYLWASDIETKLAVGGLSSSGTIDFVDIIGDVEFGFQGLFEAQNGDWTVFTDITYMKVDQDLPAPGGRVDIDIKLFLAEIGVAYRIAKSEQPGTNLSLELLAGNRILAIDLEIDPSLGPSAAGDTSFLDLFVGARAKLQVNEDLMFGLRADVGGFDLGGSDFAWQVIARGGYTLSPKMTLEFGYRVLDLEFDDSVAGLNYNFDVQLRGPFIGLRIKL